MLKPIRLQKRLDRHSLDDLVRRYHQEKDSMESIRLQTELQQRAQEYLKRYREYYIYSLARYNGISER
jgi:hypothetical protein